MPNYFVVNSANDPLYDKALILTQNYQAAQSGVLYRLTTGSQSLVIGGFLLLQITVPANTKKTIYINEVDCGSQGALTLDIFRNATFAAAGTSAVPLNCNSAFSNNSSMTVKWLTSATDPTSGGTLERTLIGTSGFIISLNGASIMTSTTSNLTYYLRITNGGVANNVSLGVSWWELPIGQTLYPNG